MNRKLYQQLASILIARDNCQKSDNQEWYEKHTDRILSLVKDHMPSGSGFDSGTAIDLDRSSADRLVFSASFHHMTEGVYDGWTEHDVIVTPSLAFGFTLRITGRNRNGIKDYMAEVFDAALNETVDGRGE